MRNPFTLHRAARGVVLDAYVSRGSGTGWKFSRSDFGWLLSGGLRDHCVAIGWYSR